MRTGIENWLLRHWYGPHQPPWYLRMLEPVYRFTSGRVQNPDRETDIYHPLLPLVVVGNISAGGSGKTPLVISLCQLALAMNIKPGIASTGYGRKSRDTCVAQADSDTRICGDEPVLLARRTGVPVVVAAHRRDAVRKLHDMDVDLIISDDGLQQADLARDIELCVVDGARGTGNGHLLPAGPLREAADRLRKVDRVITNGDWPDQPDGLQASVMRLAGDTVCSLDDASRQSLQEFRDSHDREAIHAVAAIGNPERFFTMLEASGIKLTRHKFADHHFYRRQDFDSIPDGASIIMTEKDAVKCIGLGLENAWYVPVDAVLPAEFREWFCKEITKLCKDGK